jgi:enoyl-CoA hydratase/carnithine racemase
MTFSGRIVGPEEAQAIGLPLELVEPKQLLNRANEMEIIRTLV